LHVNDIFICLCRLISPWIHIWVNAWLTGSISTEIKLPISPYKIFLNDWNEHGCYFFKCYYFDLWIIHVQSLINLPKSMWKVVCNVINVILKLKVLKETPQNPYE
jgi:hypothetical protein